MCLHPIYPRPDLTRSPSKCIHLLATFDHMNHVCIVSELLGMCIYDFLKENDFSPFPRHQIQSFARQLLNSVACAFFRSPSPSPPSDSSVLLYSPTRSPIGAYGSQARKYPARGQLLQNNHAAISSHTTRQGTYPSPPTSYFSQSLIDIFCPTATGTCADEAFTVVHGYSAHRFRFGHV